MAEPAENVTVFGLDDDGDGEESDYDRQLREQLPADWVDPAQIGRYQIVPLMSGPRMEDENVILLFDSATGRTWHLLQGVYPLRKWAPVPVVQEKE